MNMEQAPQAERRAAPKPAVRQRKPSPGWFSFWLTPMGDRSAYPSDEGQTS
jgi:hypothetical protein